MAGGAAGERFAAALRRVDAHLQHTRYLVGDQITLVDVALWVTLVRYDVGPNAQGRIGPRLVRFPRLWEYARDLYRLPAFRDTTDFTRFAAPLTTIPEWTASNLAISAGWRRPRQSQPGPRADPER